VAGGIGNGVIFKKGEIWKKVAEDQLVDVFMQELKKMEEERRSIKE
jgi:(E)-4-hydroxy-3-methylbut-2-enyl-diphosphate synthase